LNAWQGSYDYEEELAESMKLTKFFVEKIDQIAKLIGTRPQGLSEGESKAYYGKMQAVLLKMKESFKDTMANYQQLLVVRTHCRVRVARCARGREILSACRTSINPNHN
jgi:hypothetical protein